MSVLRHPQRMFIARRAGGTGLLELDFGCWEGIPWDSIPHDAIDRWALDPMNEPAGGGERLCDLWPRISSFHREVISAAAGTTAIRMQSS